jgi:protein phosphatase
MASSEQRPDFGLFIVADGMGGHEHGEKASAMATRVVAKYVTDDIFMPMLYSDPGGNAERPTVAEVLRNAVQKANEIVSEQVPEGGTTVTAAAIMGNLVYIAHVGDSRAYLITQDGIEQITRDHSLVQRLIELDQLTPEDAIEHPQRNVLYRAIGQSESLDVDAITRQIPPGGYLLLCSDGLWNLVGKEEIQEIVLQHSGSNQAACEALVGLANERGGPDNITVVLVRVPPIPS